MRCGPPLLIKKRLKNNKQFGPRLFSKTDFVEIKVTPNFLEMSFIHISKEAVTITFSPLIEFKYLIAFGYKFL